MYAVRYQVGNKKYEKAGFPTPASAKVFIEKHTSAFTWQIYKTVKGQWIEMK